MADKTSSKALQDFLGEAEEIIEKLNLDLVTLSDGLESGAATDPDLLNSIFRGAHSLKGLAGMFEFGDISELAHQMENLLDTLRLGKITLSAPVVDALFDSLEHLTRLVHGKGEREDFTLDLTSILQRISDLLDGPRTGGEGLSGVKVDPEILNVLTEYEEHRLLDNLEKGRHLLRVEAVFNLSSFDQELADLTEALKQQGEVISTLPSPGDFADKIAFQLLVGSASGAEELASVLGDREVGVETLQTGSGAGGANRQGPEVAAPAVPETETGDDEPGASLRSISRTVRVDIDKLDSLMNVVGELVLSKGALGSIGDELRAEGLSDLSLELQKATRTLERRLEELQKGVMDVRMVPVEQLFDKVSRIVRRLASELGKKVTLDIRGANTELDKLIMEELADPLMHLVRNAVDHGIETPAERLEAGKPEKGTLCLWASQKGNHVVIEMRDDGRGIDVEAVRKKAVQRGLLAEGQELERNAIYDLIFTPGFSTRDEVSDVSGRGVGMDVVKENISALSGMIEVDSRLGEGTSISVTLPITLAIIKALVVRVCGKTYAIPINSVMETLMLDAKAIRTIERREVIELRQSTLPLLRLGDVFDLPGKEEKRDRSFVAVVGLADKKMGIVVDELLGQQDVVIKSLGDTLSFVKGIAGAADLGNQKTILVLDVGGLMGEALRGEAAIYA